MGLTLLFLKTNWHWVCDIVSYHTGCLHFQRIYMVSTLGWLDLGAQVNLIISNAAPMQNQMHDLTGYGHLGSRRVC